MECHRESAQLAWRDWPDSRSYSQMSINPPPFGSYAALMIRAWKESEHTAPEKRWRFRIQDLHNGHSHGFASMEALLDFLKSEFGGETDQKEAIDQDQPR